MFKALELAIHEDVERISAKIKPESMMRFEVASRAKRFSVIFESNEYATETVDFVLSGKEITVGSEGKTKFTATVSLTDSGRCKLRVGDKELEQWQVRRMALEDLFFGTNRKSGWS